VTSALPGHWARDGSGTAIATQASATVLQAHLPLILRSLPCPPRVDSSAFVLLFALLAVSHDHVDNSGFTSGSGCRYTDA
jgi:hypothetical protein